MAKEKFEETQIVLHKQAIDEDSRNRLIASGIIPIQVEDPDDFQFVSFHSHIRQYPFDGMLWAAIKGLQVASDTGRKAFVDSLAAVGDEWRAKR